VASQQNISWTWAELGVRVDSFAAGLLSLGLQPGDRVALCAPNRAEWVVAQYATSKAGMILVNINPASRVSELEYALNKVECRAIITATKHKKSDYIAILNQLMPELASNPAPGALNAARIPSLRTVIQMPEIDAPTQVAPGAIMFDQVKGNDPSRLAALSSTLQCVQSTIFVFVLLSIDCSDCIFCMHRFDDPINIQFTSGTTGNPKGCMLTHHNILNNGYFIGTNLRYSVADRVVIPVPMYHCFGMVIGSLACMTSGAAIVLPSEGFDPLASLQAVAHTKATSLYGVPTMFIGMLDHPQIKQFDLRSLRTGVMAGSPCPIEVMKRLITDMHLKEMTICYGMTETSPVSTQSRIGDSLEKQTRTVGRVHPHLEVKIVDEHNRCVPRGATGELCTRGYSVMQGYWGDKKKTDEAIDTAGWMHTGDLATMDREGYVNIVGRIKDMVIRGGENVYPREIEEFLFKHPAVLEVQIFGVPDHKYGEELCAWIRLREGAAHQSTTVEQIRAYCRENIAHYKVPKYVRFVTEFPMTVSGKAQKYLMRAAEIKALGLSEAKTA
jgi:fatty-acyl-CoA synthase